MLSEIRKRNSGKIRKKMARPWARLLFCPLMEIQGFYQVGEDICFPIEHLVNRIAFFRAVEPPEFFRIKKFRQIEDLNEHSGRVPPVPEAQRVMDASLFYRFDGAQPFVSHYGFDRHLSFAGKKTSLNQDDIRIPLEDLLNGDDRPDGSEAGGKQVIRDVPPAGRLGWSG